MTSNEIETHQNIAVDNAISAIHQMRKSNRLSIDNYAQMLHAEINSVFVPKF